MPDQQAVLKAIQNSTRIDILQFLGENPSGVAYSDLLHFCEDSTGKLNYHLRTLSDLVLKSEQGYLLSHGGYKVLNWVQAYNLTGNTADNNKPEVVFSKLYPDSSLYTKFSIQISLISSPFLLLFLLISIIETTVWPILISFSIFVGILYTTKKYCNSIWYRITETEVEVFKGIVTYTHKIVPFRTITNVDMKQGPFDRIWGISTVEVHTAGASANQVGPEEKIIGMIDGEEIKDTIVDRIRLLNPINVIQASGRRSRLKPGLEALQQELAALNEELQVES